MLLLLLCGLILPAEIIHSLVAERSVLFALLIGEDSPIQSNKNNKFIWFFIFLVHTALNIDTEFRACDICWCAQKNVCERIGSGTSRHGIRKHFSRVHTYRESERESNIGDHEPPFWNTCSSEVRIVEYTRISSEFRKRSGEFVGIVFSFLLVWVQTHRNQLHSTKNRVVESEH